MQWLNRVHYPVSGSVWFPTNPFSSAVQVQTGLMLCVCVCVAPGTSYAFLVLQSLSYCFMEHNSTEENSLGTRWGFLYCLFFFL